jgi:hypothetical protein
VRFARALPRIAFTSARPPLDCFDRELRCLAPERDCEEVERVCVFPRPVLDRVFCEREDAERLLPEPRPEEELAERVRAALDLRLFEAALLPLVERRSLPDRRCPSRRSSPCDRLRLAGCEREAALRRVRELPDALRVPELRRDDCPDRLPLAEAEREREPLPELPRERPRCTLALLLPSARALAVSRAISLLKLLFCPRAVVSWCSNARLRSSNFSNQSSHGISCSLSSPV